ncbi:MAG: putative aliphatic sulfonates-binding protein precursor [bacterium ADurb.Bin429]|nr:MAG: putative aliphatic sulfonates-binding protein precursor [bacterium ADurb.Bin429]
MKMTIVRQGLLAASLGLAGLAALVTLTSRTTADTPLPARLALSYKVDYLPQILAQEKGYFTARGLKVAPKVVTGGIEAAEAVTSGAADLAVMGEVPALIATTAPNPAVIVATYARDENRHRIITAPGSAIRVPKDLEGKRFAVQHGSSTHGGILMYCAKHKIDVKKITLVRLSPRDMPEAMASKQIDAMAGSEPWPTNVLKRNPQAKEFAVLSGLGCNYPLVLVAGRQYIRSQPEGITRALLATQDAITLINAKPDDAAAVLAARTGLSPAQELASISKGTWALSLDTETLNGLKKMAKFLEGAGVLRGEPKWDRAIDSRYFKAMSR